MVAANRCSAQGNPPPSDLIRSFAVIETSGQKWSNSVNKGGNAVLPSLCRGEGFFNEGVVRMLDMKKLRRHFDEVKRQLAKRGELKEIDKFTELDVQRRELLQQSEQFKRERNAVSQHIAEKKKKGERADADIQAMREVGERIKALDERLRQLEDELENLLLSIPNIPHGSVPVGETEEDNVPVRYWGERAEADFKRKMHWEVAHRLGLIDIERAGKVTGSRFVFYTGTGARLERALVNFMLDLHVEEHGYAEFVPPNMVNRQSMVGTGQLPKFAEDVFRVEGTDYFMIPTAEVPITNYHRDEILEEGDLPKKFTAYTPCFRSEAGAHGRDTRGLIRLHQFNKVELVQLVKPEDSYDVLEKLTHHAERVLQLLGLPYRVVNLCSGDLGFSAAKTYDIEVWMAASGIYREISSCSNFEDFQARRANIRFRRGAKGKPEFVHTLNGSGLAIDRTVAALLEYYQQEDGSVAIPEVLQPYMGGKTHLER